MGKTMSTFGGHLLRCYQWRKSPAIWWHHFLQLPACPGRLRGCSGNTVQEPGWMQQENTAGLIPSRLARSVWPRRSRFSSWMQMARLRAVKTTRQANRLISFTVAFIILISSVCVRQAPRSSCRDCAWHWTRMCWGAGPVPPAPKEWSHPDLHRLLVDPA